MDMDDSSSSLLAARDTRKEAILSMTHFAWQDYVNLVLIDSGQVTSASIQRLKDGAVWAASKDFCITPEEVKFILEGFNDDLKLRQTGIHLNGQPFTLTRTVGRCVMVGREEKTGAGCVLYKCETCLIAGIYQENNHPGQCYSLVTQVGDYLRECDF